MKCWTMILLHWFAITVEITLCPVSSSAADNTFFETKVRPVLAEHCFPCHGPEKQKGELRLDSLAGMLSGGDSGAAITAGRPNESLLVRAINYQDYEMPPAGKLSDDKIEGLTAWIEMGAPWPGAGEESVAAVRKHEEITDDDRAYWAFQPVRRHNPPVLKSYPHSGNEIDCFVSAKLEEKGITPNGPATPRELVRRSFFDLIGLPPTPEEMVKWIERLTSGAGGDISSSEYEALLDDLLARPQYGERWGRHWLDVVRFAQTNGYERDGEKPLAWRYRDYVIDALNKDKPYDRFLIEQLAGDELPHASAESRIATGFYRLGVHDDEPDDRQQAEFDGLDDVMVTTGAAFMGLTLGCARCHSHKFDPIRHTDYYSLLAFFRNVRHYENPDDTPESATLLPISDDSEVRAAIEERRKRIAGIEAKLQEATDEAERKRLENEKNNRRLEGIQWTLAVREHGRDAPATNVLIRGNAATPGEEVQPLFPGVLGEELPDIAQPESDLFPTSGRRLTLARWLARPEHPLTARVMANRVWHYHFGRGIVPTTADFGNAGEPPTHPQLLDWLAAEFVDNGWSIKKLHKTIMLSETYRRSSHVEATSAAVDLDPGNQFLWRHNMRRLEAEAIRDTVLAVSGQLRLDAGGRGFFPQLGGEVLAGSSRPGDGWEVSPADEQKRRSVYTFVKRTVMSPMLDSFDYVNTAQPMTERSTTTVAPQALILLNDRFMHEQAEAFASRIASEVGSDTRAQIARAYQLSVQREPTEREMALTEAFYLRQITELGSLQSRLVFYPDVPVSLHNGFLNRLNPDDFLVGPRAGWTYARGRWTGGYEGIMVVDSTRGPFALWEGMHFVDAVVEANVKLSRSLERAAIIVRAKFDADSYQGYEVAILPRESKMVLSRHRGEVLTLGEAEVEIVSGTFQPIRVEIMGEQIRVAFGRTKEPLLVVTDPQPLTEQGQVGVGVWGGDFTIDELTVTSGKESIKIAGDAETIDTNTQALRSLCLLILNLNEAIYVD